jgi:hypothetical protein
MKPLNTLRNFLLCALLLFLHPANAQEFRGTITGRVTDAQQALVPDTKIVATQMDTGANYEAVSGASGQYTLPFLAPGLYRITATAPGFKRYVRQGVLVSTNERIGLDISLEIGQQVETVNVTADSPLLETASASNGQVLNSRHIEDMPVDGRTPLILAQLALGVVPSGNPQFNHPYDNSGPSGFALGGGAAGKNELLMDGSPDGAFDGTIAYSPPMDAVTEIKVEAFQADAAYGHTRGGTVDQLTKSGTNTLHGSAYDFIQLSALNATPFFTNSAGQKKSVTRFNQYGATVGGPIEVPKVYDGRNKIFFFFAYEGIKNSAPGGSLVTVPTLAERGGDFSALLKLSGNYQIYDPNSGVQQGSRVQRQPFSGNIIPASRQNAVGKNLVGYYGEPNVASTFADGSNNYYSPGLNIDNFDSELGRLDFNLSDRHKVFYDFRHNDRYHAANQVFPGNISTGSLLIQPNWGSTVDDVYTFTPQMFWNTRLNWTRNIEWRGTPGDGLDFSQLGFPASLVKASSRLGFPTVTVPGFTSFGYNKWDNNPFDSYQIFSTLHRVTGKHNLKFGADLRLYRQSSVNFGNSSGNYGFGLSGGQGWTNGPLDNSAAAPLGQELAAMLLGLPTSGSFDLNSTQTSQAKYFALFVQDDVRVSTSLTLNLGLRYERDLPTVERFNRSVNGFNATATSPISTQALAAYAKNPVPEVPASQFKTVGGLLFASPDNRDLYQTGAHNFSPRFGFAWTPKKLNGKTVIRGGTGVFFDSIGRAGVIQTGFSQTTQLVASKNGFLTPYSTLSNPFPDGLTAPPGSTLGLATYLGQGVSFTNSHVTNAYSMRWNVDIQHQLPGHVVLELGYVGNHGVHIPISENLDVIPRQYLSTSPIRDNTVVNNLTANVTNPFVGLLPGTSINGGTVQKQQLLLPYPQFTGVSVGSIPAGSSYFEMLEARLEKRFSHGFQFLANYSWSKTLDRLTFLNDTDPRPEKRISSDDRPQRLVTNATWELPLGKGKAVASDLPVVNRVIGGWSVSGIFVYQPGGAPVGWGNVVYYGGDLNWQPHQVIGTFNTSRFDTKSADQPSLNVRTFSSQFANLRADGINSLDVAIVKNNAITEKINLQYRCEIFNSLNHPIFAAPTVSPTSAQFGRITSQSNLPRSIQMALHLVW